MPWDVTLLDDDFNTPATAGYALLRVLGTTPADVDLVVTRLREEGSAGILTSGDREQAERVARKLRVFGLRVRVRAV